MSNKSTKSSLPLLKNMEAREGTNLLVTGNRQALTTVSCVKEVTTRPLPPGKRPLTKTLTLNELRNKKTDKHQQRLLDRKCRSIQTNENWYLQVYSQLKQVFLQHHPNPHTATSLLSHSSQSTKYSIYNTRGGNMSNDTRVLADASFTQRRPRLLIGGGTSAPSPEAGLLIRETLAEMANSDTTRRFRHSKNPLGRRARHSAPDLTFGGRVQLETLPGYEREDVKSRVPPAVLERRGSLGSDLELIEEESAEDTQELPSPANHDSEEEDNSKVLMPPSPVRLPPIFENQGFKLQKRDFNPADPKTNNNNIRVSDAAKYRYVRPGRKLSM